MEPEEKPCDAECDVEVIETVSDCGENEISNEESEKKNIPQLQYTREQLLEIKLLPLSKRKPECLDPAFYNAKGVWDPDKKRSDTPPDDERGGRGDIENYKRRTGDPRDRLRKEDGFVLSPQRRSFNNGCFVTPNIIGRRPESPMGKDRDIHQMPPTRRIGSGRIITRDSNIWELSRFNKSDEHEFVFPRSGAVINIKENSDRYDRNLYRREFESEKLNNRERPRYGDRRRALSDSREEEPEWFTGGPTSQHDTIELRGFEDIPEELSPKTALKKQVSQQKIKNNSKISKKTLQRIPSDEADTKILINNLNNNNNNNNNNSSSINNNLAIESEERIPPSQPTPNHSRPCSVTPPSIPTAQVPTPPLYRVQQTTDEATEVVEENTEMKQGEHMSEDHEEENMEGKATTPLSLGEFTLDDILKLDHIPGMLTNGEVNETNSVGSKFSQWFRRESPVNAHPADSRRSSLHDELLINNLMDITEPNILIPSLSDSNKYFVPISPAANTENTSENLNQAANGNGTSSKLLEILQRGGQGDSNNVPLSKTPSIRDLEAAGKMHSVEELEARLRNQGSSQNQSAKKTEEEVSAFRKLMLNKAQEAQRPQHQMPMMDQSVGGGGGGGYGSQGQQSMTIPPEFLMKLLQVQQQEQQRQDVLNKLLLSSNIVGHNNYNVPPPQPLSPLPPELQVLVNNAQPARELLQRPEAQAILQGLNQGKITPQHLIQQLQNPAQQQKHKEIILSIINLHLQSVIPRVPSPRELQVHTQQIMQTALIKKKLEEQKENFRKKQNQQSLSPNMGVMSSGKSGDASPAKHLSSPTPLHPNLAFTPTSVLRKMTAEKENENGTNGKLSENKPVGRAIVKGNSNYATTQNVDFQQPPPTTSVPPPPYRHPAGPRSKMTLSTPPPSLGVLSSPQLNMMMMMQQRPPQVQASHARAQALQAQITSLQQQQQRSMAPSVQHLMLNQSYGAGRNPGSSDSRLGGGLRGSSSSAQSLQIHGQDQPLHSSRVDIPSPSTSNQLARWLSPELLAQARAGRLPNMPPISATKKIMSLEELERLQHSSAAVPN